MHQFSLVEVCLQVLVLQAEDKTKAVFFNNPVNPTN